MESNEGPARSAHPSGSTVDEAEAAALRWAGSLRLPSGFSTSLGVAVAVQILTCAWAIAADDGHGLVAMGAGVVLFIGVAALQVHRFREANGVWLSGLGSRVVLGTAGTASAAYILGLGGALWAFFAGAAWLAAVCAGLGGTGYAWSGIRWWRRYQGAPGTYSRAESVTVVAAAGTLALLGALLLLIAG